MEYDETRSNADPLWDARSGNIAGVHALRDKVRVMGQDDEVAACMRSGTRWVRWATTMRQQRGGSGVAEAIEDSSGGRRCRQQQQQQQQEL